MEGGSSEGGSGYRRTLAEKRVMLFCHLARVLWKLSCRIEWGSLGREEYRRVDGVRPMLGRAEAKVRLARLAGDGERP